MIRADANPAKEFFLYMITKDISLEDSILDLVDNSIDGARRLADGPLDDFLIEIRLAPNRFQIVDNCGGIPLPLAQQYAFRFGRPTSRGYAEAAPHAIGLYGIGMKRALFKLGGMIFIDSVTSNDAFRTRINVAAWASHDRWEFELEEIEPGGRPPGTMIEVSQLHPNVTAEFADAVFANRLRDVLGRDYFYFLRRGLRIELNGKAIAPEAPYLLQGGEITPARISYSDEGVEIEIFAGMGELPPEDEGLAATRKKEQQAWGWWVLCNDRVVLAGDKGRATVWAGNGFPSWHPQYSGFLGLAFFRSDEPGKLPWSTTKRSVDSTSPVYRRALVRMRELTRVFVDYTNERKGVPEEIRAKAEAAARAVTLSDVGKAAVIRLPRFADTRVPIANILYKKPVADVDRVRAALGDSALSYRDVGVRTFDYFFEREVEEE